MEIVRALPDHAAAIAEVWLAARRAAIPAIPVPVHTDDEVRAYFTHVVVPTLETWVAVDDTGAPEAFDAIVGLLALADDFVDHLYIHPDHQRLGVGAALLEHAKARRPGGLQLWTFQANTDARRFYERHGFIAEQMTDGDNEEGAPDVRYRWVR